jgi:hypothetical protein
VLIIGSKKAACKKKMEVLLCTITGRKMEMNNNTFNVERCLKLDCRYSEV